MKKSKITKLLSLFLALLVVMGTSFAGEKIHPSKNFTHKKTYMRKILSYS